jgi:hypothetical protein
MLKQVVHTVTTGLHRVKLDSGVKSVEWKDFPSDRTELLNRVLLHFGFSGVLTRTIAVPYLLKNSFSSSYTELSAFRSQRVVRRVLKLKPLKRYPLCSSAHSASNLGLCLNRYRRTCWWLLCSQELSITSTHKYLPVSIAFRYSILPSRGNSC